MSRRLFTVEEMIRIARLHGMQSDALRANMADVEAGYHRLLTIMPPSVGKTRLMFAIALVLGRSPVLWLVHQRELMSQAGRDLRKDFSDLGIKPNELVGWMPPSARKDFYFCTIQYLLESIKKNRRICEPGLFKIIIVDEAHHTECMTMKVILDYLKPQYLLGCTATEDRYDGYSMVGTPEGPSTFEKISYEGRVQDAMRAGFTVPRIDVWSIKTGFDISDVKTVDGDFSEKSMDLTLRRKVNYNRCVLIANAYKQKAAEGFKRAFCFCSGVGHAWMMERAFRELGVRAMNIVGSMHKTERKARATAFERGYYDVLVTCRLFREGYNVPDVSQVVLAMPTMSRMAAEQMLGRVLRKYPGKNVAWAVDFFDIFKRHELGKPVQCDKLFDLADWKPKTPKPRKEKPFVYLDDTKVVTKASEEYTLFDALDDSNIAAA